MNVVEVSGLTKRFGKVEAVRDICRRDPRFRPEAYHV